MKPDAPNDTAWRLSRVHFHRERVSLCRRPVARTCLRNARWSPSLPQRLPLRSLDPLFFLRRMFFYLDDFGRILTRYLNQRSPGSTYQEEYSDDEYPWILDDDFI